MGRPPKYGAPQIKAGGSITFFSGIWSHRPPAEVAVVAAMNSGIEGLTRALAVELAPLEVAQTIVYLMTNTFTTGSIIFVDGGYILR